MTNECDISSHKKWEAMLQEIQKSPFYQSGIKYGKPRRGHGEGTVEAHIAELTGNLECLSHKYSFPQDLYWRLLVLIHVHDTFKDVARRDAAILDKDSHATLAKEFLSEYTDDQDMLNIVQFHDLGYAVYKKLKTTGRLDESKLMKGLNVIKDLDLFLWFVIIDSRTASKGREGVTWFVEQVNQRFPDTAVKPEHILPGAAVVDGAW